MKAFHHPLENVLRIRRTEQRQREAELAAAIAARAEAEALLRRIHQRQQNVMRIIPDHKTTAVGRHLREREQFLQDQQRRADLQKKNVAKAEEEVILRQGNLIEARQAVRQLEVHREKLYNEWQKDMQREEQRQQDDIAAGRHGRSGKADAFGG